MDQKSCKWWQNFVWENIFYQLILHGSALYGFSLILSSRVKLFTVLWSSFLMLVAAAGILIGSHRLYTHRSFKATRAFKNFILFCQTTAGTGSIRNFVNHHRLHHRFQDTDRDPVNINRGFFFAYIGNTLIKLHPDCQQEWDRVDLSDIDADPYAAFQYKFYEVLWILFSFGLSTFVPVVFWNESLWIAAWISLLKNHMTCCYTNFSNSFNHRFGTRSYDGSLSATDNKFMNIFSLGDGSHNFHHTFQQDYRGHEKGHLNFYTTIIDVAEKLGWVYDLKSTSPEIIAKRMKRTGDESRVYQSKDNSKAE